MSDVFYNKKIFNLLIIRLQMHKKKSNKLICGPHQSYQEITQAGYSGPVPAMQASDISMIYFTELGNPPCVLYL